MMMMEVEVMMTEEVVAGGGDGLQACLGSRIITFTFTSPHSHPHIHILAFHHIHILTFIFSAYDQGATAYGCGQNVGGRRAAPHR